MNSYPENCCPRAQELSLESQLGLYQKLQLWLQLQHLKANIRRERRQLLDMPAAMLRDMGISRAQAQDEAKRSDVPDYRRSLLTRACR